MASPFKLLKQAKRAGAEIAETGAKKAVRATAKAAERPTLEALQQTGAVPTPGGRDTLARKIIGTGTQGLKADAPLTGGRIPQRYPTSKLPGVEEERKQNLLINTDVLRSQPEKLQQASASIADYPNVTPEMREMNPEERVNALTRQMTDNILFLHDLMPPEARGRAAEWYLGANKIAEGSANRYGIPSTSTSGTYAALSPQKDWHQNRYQGDRTLEILDRDPTITTDMLRKAQTMPVFTRDPMTLRMMEGMVGRKLSNLKPEEQAMMVRLFDETQNPEQLYRKTTPEGGFGSVPTIKSGEPRKNVWNTFPFITKAIQAADSAGDIDVLSRLMGEKHKVRNFYNNIVAPILGRQFGDITADTHQVAASLMRPLGGASPEVSHALGSHPGAGIQAAPESATTGLSGNYPLIADATRQAAALRDIPVHAMQSIPWEAVRSLFENKSPKMQATVDAIWRAHGAGQLTADETRRRIVEASGGFKVPTW